MARTPLRGIRVLDLTNVLAGPYCSYQLMLFGAEVVKVEVPGSGDLARHLGPEPDLNNAGLGASFLAQNAGKKSIEIDLKDAAQRAVFEDLVRGADVLLENFRAGVLARLGFDWETLRALNRGLVYCAISGFGQTGPMSQAPAYDQIIQGLSGMMSITGTEDTAPLRVGFPVCDTIGGLMAALSISSALVGRERTGEGCFLDLSMLEASMSAMGWAVSHYVISGVAPTPMGQQNVTAAPSGTFETADGLLNIAANRQTQFEKLCGLLGREDLVLDPRFVDREARKRNREALNDELTGELRKRTAAEWEQLLPAIGVPAARILSVPQAVASEQLAHRGFFADVPFPGAPERTVRTSGNGVLVDGGALHPPGPPPLLGEHNVEQRDLLTRWLDGSRSLPAATTEDSR
ncbi:CaiB/BaiF CoA transferase family protein [Actinophytocola xanthii]|uniref:CoA transferase n=1 Tax=Actinophytocola xanthii TaxID=1912961 RepID=A0A1Q8CW29_9PSEU|nr:CoA transferase [Actinophytocola xanthii]OLF18559.1 CoA transferase [Actinophytocola xanthii]